MFQMLCPQSKSGSGGAQRHAGMAGFGFFNRIGGEKANGINTLFFQLVFDRHVVSFGCNQDGDVLTYLKYF